jgi:hypothetical protein
MEAWRLIIEPSRAYISVVADLHHSDDDLDPDLHQSETIGIRIEAKLRIRIRIKVKQGSH